MENFITSLYAERIGGSRFGNDTVLYKFEKIKRWKKQALMENPHRRIIDLGVGEPDWMADPGALETLAREAADWNNRGYTDNGLPEFNQAAAQYKDRVFGVSGLDPEREINHGIGSKPILAMLPHAFINPGDIALVTVPGYPILGDAVKALGGEVVSLPLKEENAFLPDFSILSEDQKKKAKLLYLNYPNNPTGAVANEAFYAEVIDFARKNQIIVVSDEAYAALVYGDVKPLSFLTVPGAKEVGVSVQSLSKAFNMTGWRIAFIAGNAAVVKAFAAVKDNHDSGQFAAIQKAAIYCLNHPEITEKTAEKYARRHERLAEILTAAGFQTSVPGAGFYQYVRVPENAEAFCAALIKEKGILTVPWDDAGSYFRASVTFPARDEHEEKKIFQELYERLK